MESKSTKIHIPYANETEKQINYLLDNESLVETEYKNHCRLTKWGELQVKGRCFQIF